MDILTERRESLTDCTPEEIHKVILACLLTYVTVFLLERSDFRINDLVSPVTLVGELMYVTVCPPCGPGSIPGFDLHHVFFGLPGLKQTWSRAVTLAYRGITMGVSTVLSQGRGIILWFQ